MITGLDQNQLHNNSQRKRQTKSTGTYPITKDEVATGTRNKKVTAKFTAAQAKIRNLITRTH